jgi:hypothetical protein
MNVPTRWTEDRIDEGTLVFRSEHTFGGRREVTARVVFRNDSGWEVVFDNADDAPHFIIERAKEVLL